MARRTGKYGNFAQKNLAVLKYLSEVGNWSNPNQIRLGAGGNANPRDITDILEGFLARKYITPRPSPVKKEWIEYKITALGTENSKAFDIFLETPGRKHMLGLPEPEEK